MGVLEAAGGTLHEFDHATPDCAPVPSGWWRRRPRLEESSDGASEASSAGHGGPYSDVAAGNRDGACEDVRPCERDEVSGVERNGSRSWYRGGQVTLAIWWHEPIACGEHDDHRHVDVADPTRRAEPTNRLSRLPDHRFGVLGHGVEHAVAHLAIRQHAGDEWPGHALADRRGHHRRDLLQLLQRTGERPQVGSWGEVGRRRAQHESTHPVRVATPHQLGDRAAHRVADHDRPAHAEHVHQGRCIIGAVLEGEGVVSADPPSVPAMVERDDPVPLGQPRHRR